MKFNNFALSSTKIKSNWFEGGKKSIYKQIGEEEGLNLYLQLFRFRLHQMVGTQKENYTHHIFRITIGELTKFTKINLTKKLTHKQIVDLLKKMEKAGIIKLHTPSRWNQLVDDNGKIKSDKLVVLQATDVPNTYVEKNEKGQDVDKPVNEDEDWYVPINFRMIEYIYNDLSLTSKELTVYLLLMKFSNGGEHKATININTMKDRLGFSNETIIEILKVLNKNRLVATYVKRKKKKISFEHVPLKSFNHIDSFKRVNEEQCIKFLNRYKKKDKAKSEKSSPFDNVDEAVESDDWGSIPNGYNKETGEIEIIL